MMAFIDHDFVLQRHAAHLLAGGGIGKGLHHKIVLLGHDHELHTLFPIAEAVVLEVLPEEILGVLLFLLSCCQLIGHLSLGTLLGSLRLHDIGILLGRCCQKGKSHTGRKNHSFHDYR